MVSVPLIELPVMSGSDFITQTVPSCHENIDGAAVELHNNAQGETDCRVVSGVQNISTVYLAAEG